MIVVAERNGNKKKSWLAAGILFPFEPPTKTGWLV